MTRDVGFSLLLDERPDIIHTGLVSPGGPSYIFLYSVLLVTPDPIPPGAHGPDPQTEIKLVLLFQDTFSCLGFDRNEIL